MNIEQDDIDRGDDDPVKKATEKSKIMRDVASRMIDLARSMELEATFMVKAAKAEADRDRQEAEVATDAEEVATGSTGGY